MSSLERPKHVAVVVASLVVHAAVALALVHVHRLPPASSAPSPTPREEAPADFELDATYAPLAEAEAEVSRTSVASRSAERHSDPVAVGSRALPRSELDRREHELGRLAKSEPTQAPAVVEEATLGEPTNPSPTSTAPARSLSLADLGVGKNPFTGTRGEGTGNPAPSERTGNGTANGTQAEAAAAKERVEASLRADARAREAQIGLGPDGPVRSALMDAMYASDAPVTSRVVFAVVADAQGKVLSVEAVSADRGLSAFQGMARLAREKLARSTLRLPSSAKGATLRVEVTSAWKLPSGHDPGTSVELFGKALTKGEGKASTKVTILGLPKVTCVAADDPKNDLRLPVCGISLPLFATDGDPANIGAKPRRIVATKVVESTIL